MARPDIAGLGKGGRGGWWLESTHTHTRSQSLACALVREGIFLGKKIKRMALVFGTFFCKKKIIIQTSLHDDKTGGVGVQVSLHLSSLGFTFEMCMCIYTQSSIKLCKASCGF